MPRNPNQAAADRKAGLIKLDAYPPGFDLKAKLDEEKRFNAWEPNADKNDPITGNNQEG